MFPVREKSPQCIHRSSCPVLPRLDSPSPLTSPHLALPLLASFTSSRTLVLHRHSALCLTLSRFALLPLLVFLRFFSPRNLTASPHLISRLVSLRLASPRPTSSWLELYLASPRLASRRLASVRLVSLRLVLPRHDSTRLDSTRLGSLVSSSRAYVFLDREPLYAGVTVPRSPLSFLTMEMYR